MADFRRKRKFTTKTPQLQVAAGLPAGTYTFQLVVVDQSGNQSKAARVKVKIVGGREPITPVGGGVLVDTPVITRGPTIRRPPG